MGRVVLSCFRFTARTRYVERRVQLSSAEIHRGRVGTKSSAQQMSDEWGASGARESSREERQDGRERGVIGNSLRPAGWGVVAPGFRRAVNTLPERESIQGRWVCESALLACVRVGNREASLLWSKVSKVGVPTSALYRPAKSCPMRSLLLRTAMTWLCASWPDLFLLRLRPMQSITILERQ